MVLRLGEARDLLVGINGDSEATLARLRTDYADWLDETIDPAEIDPVFSVRLHADASVNPDHRGPRPVPQLRYGQTVLVRSRADDDVLAGLSAVLGGVHAQQLNDPRVWITLRPFVRGDDMVLVSLGRPTLVNDPRLAAAGIVELPAWAVLIEGGDASSESMVSVPPPLLSGEGRQSGGWRRYRLAGVLVAHDEEGPPAALVTEVSTRSISPRWFGLLARLAEAGLLVDAVGREAVRDRLHRLLAPVT